MLIAESPETLQGKGIVDAFGLLQAKHIGPRRFEEFGDEVNAQAHRIDIPGGQGELHLGTITVRACCASSEAIPSPISWESGSFSDFQILNRLQSELDSQTVGCNAIGDRTVERLTVGKTQRSLRSASAYSWN